MTLLPAKKTSVESCKSVKVVHECLRTVKAWQTTIPAPNVASSVAFHT